MTWLIVLGFVAGWSVLAAVLVWLTSRAERTHHSTVRRLNRTAAVRR